ncbi:site-specific DNA-methyltransferase [Faecalibacterium prausnitzii]|jgi:DNA modification methylase|uniref:site-specific DNA-methyltransferase n=1 Tax=Faecalibacterium prausnitzii TaxID=853 RepID=UPI000E416CDD|nr:site-specific DNA-methyltransferase [Faecalibacterium prausnitzii]RGC40971.1 site-specific DNA-methyltransferase [Faecalibacterium prausnitzii]
MSEVEQLTFEFAQRPTIKGFPELRWTGKRPYKSTQYYPAQLRETYGEDQNGWMNKIFWGDNLQVMSHLLKEYRGQIDLIYIDPPFDSKADYKKKIDVKGVGKAESDSSTFEEKQYGDIWTNDEYLQFMYERLILLRELLSERGSIYLHCDWHRSAYLRLLLDEVFGANNFRNEIVWSYFGFKRATSKKFPQKHDVIYSYTKSPDYIWNVQYKPHSPEYIKRFKKDANGRLYRDDVNPTGGGTRIIYLDEVEGDIVDSVWTDIPPVNPVAKERQNYPTQKPEALIERIIKSSTNPGDLVFDCFMGSGTTQAVAMKLGRRFIGADINLGAIQTTTKRLVGVANELNTQMQEETKYTGFEVYNVNNYDFFRNPVEARDLLIQALEIQPFPQSNVWDGELDGRMVKIMPVNRIATKADLKELLANLPYATYEKRKEENPNQPVEHMTIVCMGHEPDLKGSLEQELSNYKVDVQILDVLRDKADLQLKRDSEAEIVREGNKLVIREFFPMNLMQKLSLQKEYVEEWRQLVDSVMIDWNYDGAVMQPRTIDIPEKNELVKGVYDIPEDAGTIKVKITDLLSESLEVEVR